MKKFLLLITMAIGLIATMPLQSEAQTPMVGANSLTTDTVTNTASKTLVLKVPGYHSSVTIQVDITKISGTLGGTLVPIASNDGTTYYDCSASSSDTVTVANSESQGKLYSMPPGYLYYGVKWTGTGTMSGSFTAKLLARKPTQ